MDGERGAPVILDGIGGGWRRMLVARGGGCLVERGGTTQWEDGRATGVRCGGGKLESGKFLGILGDLSEIKKKGR